MVQIEEMSHEDKVKMYSKLKKSEIINMLINANREIDKIIFPSLGKSDIVNMLINANNEIDRLTNNTKIL